MKTFRMKKSFRRLSARLRISRLVSSTGIILYKLCNHFSTSRLCLQLTRMTLKREQSSCLTSETTTVSLLIPFKSFLVKKTIIFDLDETLVHCIDDIESNPCDQVINVTFPNGETV